jgi:hypothetical protein
MPMTPLERKAAFKHAVTLNQTTLEAASRDVIGVTGLHLSLGINEEETRRGMSPEVKQKFAEYIGRTVEEVFGAPTEATAA